MERRWGERDEERHGAREGDGREGGRRKRGREIGRRGGREVLLAWQSLKSGVN